MTRENIKGLRAEEFVGTGLIIPVKKHSPQVIIANEAKAKEEAKARKEKAAKAKEEREKEAAANEEDEKSLERKEE